MLKITSGLVEGQVIQRNPVDASLHLTLIEFPPAPLTATLRSHSRTLKGWNKRKLTVTGKKTACVLIDKIPAGGPYELILNSGKESATIRSFYVGDVWILAGQSNMQGCGNMGGAPKSHPLIRTLTMARKWRKAAEPLHLMAESPDTCHNGGAPLSSPAANAHRKNATKGTGPGLYFACEMLAHTGVPQGLIATAHGGTSMLQWQPQSEIDGELTLYGSMLQSVRVTHQPVAGVLWYQGESDTNPDTSAHYTDRMKQLVLASRKDLRQPKLPWVIVQLARVFNAHTKEQSQHWNAIQEQQRLLPSRIPALGMISAIDLSLDDQIHISSEGHAILGKRLAREASRLTKKYSNRRLLPPPSLKNVSGAYIPKGSAATRGCGLVVNVTFENVTGSLTSEGLPSGFAIIDPEGHDTHTIHKITLQGNTARVHLTTFDDRCRLAYGHGRVPTCTIQDRAGHALPVFGPQSIGQPRAFLPFVKNWKTHPPVTSELSLAQLKTSPEKMKLSNASNKSYQDDVFNLEGFVNEHETWQNQSGLAFFSSHLTLPEAMKLEFLMGYDGPFRLWLDGKPFFTDMHGINPCFADESSKLTSLSKGKHRIDIGMDIQHGTAWGFFLRFIRKDVNLSQVKSGQYAKPHSSLT
jgi:sialate O-acetylesterase